jgi:hypothetical protein
MRSADKFIVTISALAALTMPSFVTAQHTAALGDLMTALVQPRHIKLGLAGKRTELALCRL